MVFSKDTIINSKSLKPSYPELEKDYNISFFTEAIDKLSSSSYDLFKEFTFLQDEDLQEGIFSNVVVNSVKRLNYKNILENVLNRFVTDINSIQEDFENFMNDFIDNNVFNIEKIENYKGIIENYVPEYSYRNFGVNTVNVLNYRNDINRLNSNIIEFFNSIDDIQNAVSESISYTDSISAIQRTIIKNHIIDSGYEEALYNLYRLPVDENYVSQERIQEAINDYFNIDKLVCIGKRESNKYTEVTREFVEQLNDIDITLDEDTIIPYNRLISAKCRQFKDICETYLLSYVSKLDAIKDYTMENYSILSCISNKYTDDYTTNINEYALSYDVYTAEKEYYLETSNILNNMLLTEQVTLGYVNEAFGNTVAAYIDKVTKSTQKAYNRFDSRIKLKKDKKFLKRIRENIINFKPSNWRITNYPNYDFKPFKGIKILVLNYNEMKTDLEKVETFVTNNYKNLKFPNKKFNVKKAIKTTIIKQVVPTYEVTKTFLIERFNFCAKEYLDYKESIKADLETFNNNNKVILNLGNTIAPNESVNFKTVYESMIYEAPTTVLEPKTPPKMGFSDNDGHTIKTRKNNAQNMFMRRIHVYMKVSTDILTGKMTVLNQAYKDYMRILTVAYRQKGANVSVTGTGDTKKAKIEVNT